MTTQSYQPKQSNEGLQSVCNSLITRFRGQLERLGRNASELENIGHKLKNTNYPRAEEGIKGDKTKVTEDGFLPDIDLLLNRLESHNDNMEETLKKLSELI